MLRHSMRCATSHRLECSRIEYTQNYVRTYIHSFSSNRWFNHNRSRSNDEIFTVYILVVTKKYKIIRSATIFVKSCAQIRHSKKNKAVGSFDRLLQKRSVGFFTANKDFRGLPLTVIISCFFFRIPYVNAMTN